MRVSVLAFSVGAREMTVVLSKSDIILVRTPITLPICRFEEAISIPILTDHLSQRISLPLLSPPLLTFLMRLGRHYLRFSSFIPSPAS